MTWTACGEGCPDQECFHQLLLSNASFADAVAILGASTLSCHVAHYSYLGTCNPWAVHTLGWTKGVFLNATATARLRQASKLSPQTIWNIAVRHNPSYSRALGMPPPRTVPSRKPDAGCAGMLYARVVKCLDLARS